MARAEERVKPVGLGYQPILAQSVGALLLLVLAAFVAVGASAAVAAFLRSQGKELPSIRIRDLVRPSPHASARPGTVTGAADLPTGCMLYLGQADGTTLVHDPAGRTLRLPSGDVVVSLDHSERC